MHKVSLSKKNKRGGGGVRNRGEENTLRNGRGFTSPGSRLKRGVTQGKGSCKKKGRVPNRKKKKTKEKNREVSKRASKRGNQPPFKTAQGRGSANKKPKKRDPTALIKKWGSAFRGKFEASA